MKTKILIYIIIIASMLLNVEKDSDCEKYEKLEIKNAPSIKREDLPEEFSEKAFETVDEFIRKTADLNYEIALHFDYMTGEIINCAIGKLDKVEIEVDEEQMKDKRVASIHNHPKGVFSPPSGKNFRIFEREYEDYELIAGLDSFWILKAKGICRELISEMNIVSETILNLSFIQCASRYSDDEIINRMTDVKYGNQLSKYLSNKNINGIQLIKTEYNND